MALVIQTAPLRGDYVPFERPPQNLTLWSAIPRGLQSFIGAGNALTAKPVNDTFLLSMTATLPPNFAYVMADGNLRINQDRAADWNTVCNLNLQNFFRGPTNLSVALSSDWPQDFIDNAPGLGTIRALAMRQAWPTFPIIGVPGTAGALVVFTATNVNATVAAAGTFDSYLSFWQFDLEQIRKYPINSPVPVHAR